MSKFHKIYLMKASVIMYHHKKLLIKLQIQSMLLLIIKRNRILIYIISPYY